jgi:hypothetical protein
MLEVESRELAASGLPVERLAVLRRRVIDSNGLDSEAVTELRILVEEARGKAEVRGLSPTQVRAHLARRRCSYDPRMLLAALVANRD